MSTCQHCGIENSPIHSLCTTCGTSPPKPASGTEAELSALWRIRFDLIEKAGGPTRPHFKQLSFGERFRLAFNLWALLFGPFYYLAKGMWRKAIVAAFIGLPLMILINVAAPDGELDPLKMCVNTLINVWFTLHANINYYKKIVLDDNGWW
ncbi:DUF2628 domain-containing protein [Oxalobacteraceae bacterium OTU3CAMAD1]|nr:DUF2628 domain-containing protein [Oxalobacteraceae bacterium OTU3CAMAD1]